MVEGGEQPAGALAPVSEVAPAVLIGTVGLEPPDGDGFGAAEQVDVSPWLSSTFLPLLSVTGGLRSPPPA